MGKFFNNLSQPSAVSVIVAMIGAIGMIVAAFVGNFGMMKITFLPVEATQTAEGLHTSIPATAQPTDVFDLPTIRMTPTTSTEDQLLQLVADYYTCINSANPDQDSNYESCWNLLSNKPGEFQSHLNKNDYKAFWKKYKVAYALYRCSKNLQHYVDTQYYLYDRNDLSHPIGRGEPSYLEWSFALDESGWRLKGANDSLKEIGSYCEGRPGLEKLTLTP